MIYQKTEESDVAGNDFGIYFASGWTLATAPFRYAYFVRLPGGESNSSESSSGEENSGEHVQTCDAEFVKLRIRPSAWDSHFETHGEPDFIYDCVMLNDRTGTSKIASNIAVMDDDKILGM